MKLLKKLAIMAMAAFAFTACEDVPAPYELPDGGGSGNETLSENLLENHDFETWENGAPVAWDLTVSNATIEQSSDAMSGTSSVLIEGYEDSNKRFASKSYFLLPGTYYLSAYIKKDDATAAGKFRMGYAILTNGVAVDYTTDYQYLTTATEATSEWSEITANFKLEKTTEISIMLVNSKSNAPVLVDNVTLKTIGGGLSEDNNDTPDTPTNTYINEPLSNTLGSFSTTEVIGSYPWEISTQYKCAKVTGFSDNMSNAAESWLVSSSFDLTNETAAYISFDYVIAYSYDDITTCHQVLFSSDYNGDVTTATWESIDYNPIKSGSWTLENTGKIAIPETMYGKSNVTVAFKYTSSTNNASTWEVANVIVAPGEGNTTPDDEPSTPGEASSIANVIAAGPGAAKVSGTIIATYERGFIVNDETASILVYLSGTHEYTAGDIVTVEGTTSQYAGMLQFGAGAIVEKTGTTDVTHPTVSVMSAADMDAYLAAPVIKYVQYTGKLTINGYYYNVEIDGASKAVGSISYPVTGLVDESLNGKNITVTGYTIGVSSSKYVNTMATSVIAADDTPTPDDGDDDDDNEGGIAEAVVFDFTNPTSLDPSITPAESGAGVEFDEVTFKNGDVTITAVKNNATTKVRIWTLNSGATELRTYNKSSITISGKGMKKIVFDGKKTSGMTPNTGSLSEDGVWTGNANSVTFNVSATLNINKIIVE